MGLRDAILEYEKHEAEAIFKEAKGKMGLALRLFVSQLRKCVMDGNVARAGILLDEAYKLNGAALAEDNLDNIIGELDRVDRRYCISGWEKGEALSIRKEWIRAKVAFYQQLIRQEGKASTFEDAARNQFKSEDSYRAALKGVWESEEKLYAAALRKIQPLGDKIYNICRDASIKTRSRLIGEMFNNFKSI
jgi:hypothetical protein